MDSLHVPKKRDTENEGSLQPEKKRKVENRIPLAPITNIIKQPMHTEPENIHKKIVKKPDPTHKDVVPLVTDIIISNIPIIISKHSVAPLIYTYVASLFNILPKVLQMKIFDYLSYEQKVLCRQVCKDWNVMLSVQRINEYHHLANCIKLNQPLPTTIRFTLIDWLMEVQHEFNLRSTTIFLAVNYLDRCLALCEFKKNQLQLLTICCIWIAAKFEELKPPTVSELIFICDDLYGSANIITMERNILNLLKFNISCVTSYTFLNKYLELLHQDTSSDFVSLIQFLLELALLHEKISKFFTILYSYISFILGNKCI